MDSKNEGKGQIGQAKRRAKRQTSKGVKPRIHMLPSVGVPGEHAVEAVLRLITPNPAPASTHEEPVRAHRGCLNPTTKGRLDR